MFLKKQKTPRASPKAARCALNICAPADFQGGMNHRRHSFFSWKETLQVTNVEKQIRDVSIWFPSSRLIDNKRHLFR